MSGELSEIPASFKSILPHLKIAVQHEQRDIVISYWARLYALQTALKMSKKKSQEENSFLMKLMTWLEDTKKANQDNEAITNEVAAQAHIENYALKLFLYADENDRASNFTRAVIQSFYTAGLLYDTLTTFGELSEEAAQNKKYAQWKATYINNCLKNGETPVPGPVDNSGDSQPPPAEDLIDNEDDEKPEEKPAEDATDEGEEEEKPEEEEPAQPTPPPKTSDFGFPPVPNPSENTSASTPTTPQMPQTFQLQPGVNLTAEQMMKAQKYIKWAGSAMNYEDIPTAVDNLQKALRLLTTGQDSQ